jgi:hypothetical protein
MSLRSNLYRSARILGDLQAAASGNPKRIERRAKNKLVAPWGAPAFGALSGADSAKGR